MNKNINYTDYTRMTSNTVKNIKPGYAIIPTYPDVDDNETALHCKILEVNTTGRLKLILVDVDGKVAIMYWNGCFKNMMAGQGYGYCSEFRDGSWYDSHDCHFLTSSRKMDTEEEERWTSIINQYVGDESFYYGYCGDKDHWNGKL